MALMPCENSKISVSQEGVELNHLLFSSQCITASLYTPYHVLDLVLVDDYSHLWIKKLSLRKTQNHMVNQWPSQNCLE